MIPHIGGRTMFFAAKQRRRSQLPLGLLNPQAPNCIASAGFLPSDGLRESSPIPT
jgi:hypothetical protein